jgi:hypothetical protein
MLKSFFPLLYTPYASVPMFSPIAREEFDEAKYREFIRTLSDEELIRTGKQLR